MRIFFCLHILFSGLYFLHSNSCKTRPQTTIETESETEEKPEVVEKEPVPKDILTPVMELPAILPECSGMAWMGDDTVIALNDSGFKTQLYLFSIRGKKEVRVVKVKGVKNNDWEEIADDDD